MANDPERAVGLRQVLSKVPFAALNLGWEDVNENPGRKSAVLVPLFPREGEPFLLLVERSDSLRHHPGQLAFPGGVREEQDRGPVETALREFTEETGIPADKVEILGALPEVRAYSSGFTLFPVVGYLPLGVRSGDLSPDSREVKNVLEVPLRELEGSPRMETFTWKGHVHHYPVYQVGGGVTLWGATAWIILNLIRSLQRQETRASSCP
jgi:8-oxo-dGTP pyrophosphatase MutT (NUDIX family)